MRHYQTSSTCLTTLRTSWVKGPCLWTRCWCSRVTTKGVWLRVALTHRYSVLLNTKLSIKTTYLTLTLTTITRLTSKWRVVRYLTTRVTNHLIVKLIKKKELRRWRMKTKYSKMRLNYLEGKQLISKF